MVNAQWVGDTVKVQSGEHLRVIGEDYSAVHKQYFVLRCDATGRKIHGTRTESRRLVWHRNVYNVLGYTEQSIVVAFELARYHDGFGF
jgi:hypothetical protein